MKKVVSVLLVLMMLMSTLVVTASAAYENTHINTGNQRVDILEVAKTQLKNTNYSKYSNYPNAWCADFVVWCARQAGISETIIKNTSVAHPEDFGVEERSPSEHSPDPGDLVFFDWPSYDKKWNHVGIVEYVENDGTVHTIEGNTSGRVDRCEYSKNGNGEFNRLSSIIAYGVPKYKGEGVHVHNYAGEGYEQAHPHKVYRICECGTWEYVEDQYKTLDTCIDCNPTTLKVYYNANGGSISSDTYKLSSDLVYLKADSTKYFQKWTYDKTKEDGLINYSSFGLYRKGYTFAGWGTAPSGGEIFSQSDSTLKPTDINPDLKNGNCATILYAQWEPNVLSVKFNANGGSISSDTFWLNSGLVYNTADSSRYYQTWTYNNTKTDGLINYSTFGLYKKGYTFAGWGTKASGGTVFSQSDSTLKPTDINPELENGSCTATLYAQWATNVLTVNYNINGGSIDSDKYKLNSGMLMYASNGEKVNDLWAYDNAPENGLYNPGTFGIYKTGYTFAGWSTKASGGTVFHQDDTTIKAVNINADIKTGNCSSTLYAQWKANVLTVNYNINGGSINSDKYNLDSGVLTYASNGKKVNDLWVYDNAPENGLYNPGTFGIYKEGYKFAGWGTKPSGGTVFNQNDTTLKASDINSVVTESDCTTELYAQWTPITYTVSFDANGGNVATSSAVAGYGESVNLPTPSKTYVVTYNANGGTGSLSDQTAFVEFLGWSTSKTATSADYLGGDSYKPSADTTLYAVWAEQTSRILSSVKPTRIGYTFLGWSLSDTATTSAFAPGEKITLSDNITLYAVWQKLENPTDTPAVVYKTVQLDYQEDYKIKPDGYEASRFILEKDSEILTVDSDGTVTAVTVGSSLVYVYDSNNHLREIYTFEVDYASWQWLIIIFLFGWIWYI